MLYQSKVALFAGLVCLVALFSTASAKDLVMGESQNEVVVTKIADLPRNGRYITEKGVHYDIGYRYRQITIFYVPIWSYDGHWCGYLDGRDEFHPLSEYNVQKIASREKIELPMFPISAWVWLGGKLLAVFVLFLCLLLLGAMAAAKK